MFVLFLVQEGLQSGKRNDLFLVANELLLVFTTRNKTENEKVLGLLSLSLSFFLSLFFSLSLSQYFWLQQCFFAGKDVDEFFHKTR